jgi:hypothetical protein
MHLVLDIDLLLADLLVVSLPLADTQVFIQKHYLMQNIWIRVFKIAPGKQYNWKQCGAPQEVVPLK